MERLRREAQAFKGSWDYAMRARLLALDPAQLLTLLDDDELLLRRDARDLVKEIYAACGLPLLLLPAKERGALDGGSAEGPASLTARRAVGGDGWCVRLAPSDDPTLSAERMKLLLQLVAAADPSEPHPGERAELRAREATARADGSLAALVLEDDAMLVSAAVQEMWKARDHHVIDDWSGFERLDEVQRNAVLEALWFGMECRWLGDCSAHSLPVAALCQMPGFQCDRGTDYQAVVRRSLSPAQFNALTMLMNGVNAYRRRPGD